ncbi:Protein ABHD11, partial [Araneus ventricosus]
HIPVRLAYNSFEPQCDGWCLSPYSRSSPIIFLHGLTSCKETWGNIPQMFANELKRKAYTLDARNHGDSDWSDIFTTDDLVNDLLFFMDAVNADRTILIGHSMGGTVAIQMALEAPDKVEMIIVEEMFVSQPPEILLEIPLLYVRRAPLAVKMIPRDADDLEAVRFIRDYVNKGLPPGLMALQYHVTVYEVCAGASESARSQSMRFLLVGHLKDAMYRENPTTIAYTVQPVCDESELFQYRH